MELTDEMMTEKKLSEHVNVDIKGKEYSLQLDELPIPHEDFFTKEKQPYELMAFPVMKNGEVDYGKECFVERYATEKEALKRYVEVLGMVKDGYTLEDIPPKNLHMEVVSEPTQFEGLKLNANDVITKNRQGVAIYVAKPDESIKEDVLYERNTPKSMNHTASGFIKTFNEEGKMIWKAEQLSNHKVPVNAMYRAAAAHLNHKAMALAKKAIYGKEIDHIMVTQPFAFTRSVGKEVVVDSYMPYKGVKGVYKHNEATYDQDGLKKLVTHGPETMTWKTFKKNCEKEFQMIEEAKQQKILYLPGNTTLRTERDIAEMEKNPALHSMPQQKLEQTQTIVTPKRSLGKGQERQ